MKIAIKANPSRGREIISLLESLGGINGRDWKGDGKIDTYYIDKNNKINYDRAPAGYKVYTLEEFEKEDKFTKTYINEIKQAIMYNPDYWTKLEHQYAGMFLQAQISYGEQEDLNAEEMVEDAMIYAHALVQKLKESK